MGNTVLGVVRKLHPWDIWFWERRNGVEEGGGTGKEEYRREMLTSVRWPRNGANAATSRHVGRPRTVC